MKQEIDIVLMSHLKNRVLSRHAMHYCCSYHIYHYPKSSLILGDQNPFNHKGLKTLQLSTVVHHFPPGAEMDVPILYQEHIKSS